jgi:hypothetical protein
LAIADFKTRSAGSLAHLVEKLKISKASPAFLPLIISITNLTLRGDILINFALAVISIVLFVIFLSPDYFGAGAAGFAD